MTPTIPSLQKNCGAFGITMSQLFAREHMPVCLSDAQWKRLAHWTRLSKEQQAAVLALIETM